MRKYTAEIESIQRDEQEQIASVAVSVYGDLPRLMVAVRTQNAIIRAAQRVLPGANAEMLGWEQINYRVAVHNGQERHEVIFSL